MSLLGSLEKLLVCPITKQVLNEPVLTSCGHTFEKEALAAWVEKKTFGNRSGNNRAKLKCPSCSANMEGFAPNSILREVLDEMKKAKARTKVAEVKKKIANKKKEKQQQSMLADEEEDDVSPTGEYAASGSTLAVSPNTKAPHLATSIAIPQQQAPPRIDNAKFEPLLSFLTTKRPNLTAMITPHMVQATLEELEAIPTIASCWFYQSSARHDHWIFLGQAASKFLEVQLGKKTNLIQLSPEFHIDLVEFKVYNFGFSMQEGYDPEVSLKRYVFNKNRVDVWENVDKDKYTASGGITQEWKTFQEGENQVLFAASNLGINVVEFENQPKSLLASSTSLSSRPLTESSIRGPALKANYIVDLNEKIGLWLMQTNQMMLSLKPLKMVIRKKGVSSPMTQSTTQSFASHNGFAEASSSSVATGAAQSSPVKVTAAATSPAGRAAGKMVVPNSKIARNAKWQYLDGDGWRDFPASVQEQVEQLYVVDPNSFAMITMNPLNIEGFDTLYQLDFKEWTQRNTRTKNYRPIRRCTTDNEDSDEDW